MKPRVMINFTRGGAGYNQRVAAILLHKGRVLLHRACEDDFWTLPGGRVELLESSREALAREMREELEAAIAIRRLVWVVENFFAYQGRDWHELAFYYLISLRPDSAAHVYRSPSFAGVDNGMPLVFCWFELRALENVELYPAFLRRGLSELPATTQHLVYRE